MSPRHLGLDYLRGCVVLQVVVFHGAMAYANLPGDTPIISDPHASVAALIFIMCSDVYFMALLFLVSGLFVWPSLAAKGPWGFIRARGLRLGLPFVLGVALLMPPTYYAWLLSVGGKLDLLTYWGAYFFQRIWPTGPLWFLLVLLVFDLAAAALYRLAPRIAGSLGRWASGAAQQPLRFCLALVACASAAFLVLLVTVGPRWVDVGPFSLQASRLLLYATFFLAGVGIGAGGIDHGLLGRESLLVRRWSRWVWAAVAAQLLYLTVLFLAVPALVRAAPLLAGIAYSVAFASACAVSGLALLAVFQRFARPNAILDSVAANAFGIFIVHYFFVFWAQYLLLGWDLPSLVKATLVAASALVLSWACVALFRRLPILLERRLPRAEGVP